MLWDDERLTFAKLREYCGAVGEESVWGFIDGTAQQVSRPGEHQRCFYSGHIHYHAYKVQGIVTPDSIISSLAGPIEGSREDWYLFKLSTIERKIACQVICRQWR